MQYFIRCATHSRIVFYICCWLVGQSIISPIEGAKYFILVHALRLNMHQKLQTSKFAAAIVFACTFATMCVTTIFEQT